MRKCVIENDPKEESRRFVKSSGKQCIIQSNLSENHCQKHYVATTHGWEMGSQFLFFFSYITDIGKSRVEDLIQSKSNANDPKDPPFLPKPSSAANLVRNFCIFNYAVVCRAKSQVAKDVDLVAG